MERSVYHRLDQLEGEHWWFCARRSILKSVIERFAPRGRKLRLLEAGCGTGGNLRMLSEFGRIEAFEIDTEARAIAATKVPVVIRSGALPDRIPFPPGTFDVVAAFDVLEHVEQDVASLRKLMDQLAPGGRLIVTVPALPSLWSRHDETHHHYRRYTKGTLESALRQAGLKPVAVSYFNSLLFPLIAGIRLAKKALGRQEAADDFMPPAWVNGALKAVFGFERNFIGRLPLPAGVSLLAVAEKPQ